MTTDNIKIVTNLLKQFEPGFLPYSVFEQIARLVVLPILEFIPLRKTELGIEVLLIARPEDDPFWPGLLHTPGTVIRATDINKDHSANWPASERIIQDELAGTQVSRPHFAGSQLHTSKRGVEQAQIYWVEVKGDPLVGTYYLIDDLPVTLIESQIAFIKLAVSSYETWLKKI